MNTLIKNATVRGHKNRVDIAISGDIIADIAPHITHDCPHVIDADGKFVSAPFVDAHFHLDATLTLVLTGVNKTGTVLEGIQMWKKLKPQLTVDMVKKRALEYCHWAIARGILAMRSHVDVCDDHLTLVDALLEVKKEIAPYLDLQLVAFPQDGYFRHPNAIKNITRALDKGVDVIGGIPHYERTVQQGDESLKAIMKTASERGIMVDIHCDETDDPHSRHIETLCAETVKYGMQGRVAGSHLVAMPRYGRFYFEKLKALLGESNMQIITNPQVNITLQGRLDGLEKRRGFAPVVELQQLGLNIAMAQDCVLDPWYGSGRAEMLEVAHMGYHIAHMTAPEQIESCFDMITTNPAKIMGLEKYGIAKGNYADLIIFNAPNAIECIRQKSERLVVMRRGKIIAKTEPAQTTVNIFNNIQTIDFITKNTH